MVKTKKNKNQSQYYSKKRLSGGAYGQVSTFGRVRNTADLASGSITANQSLMSAIKDDKNIIMYLESESHGSNTGAAQYIKARNKLTTFRKDNISQMGAIIKTLSSNSDATKAKAFDQLQRFERTCAGERMQGIKTTRTSQVEKIKSQPVSRDSSKSQLENELNRTIQETRGVVLENLATLVYEENLKLETALAAIIQDPKAKNFKNSSMI